MPRPCPTWGRCAPAVTGGLSWSRMPPRRPRSASSAARRANWSPKSRPPVATSSIRPGAAIAFPPSVGTAPCSPSPWTTRATRSAKRRRPSSSIPMRMPSSFLPPRTATTTTSSPSRATSSASTLPAKRPCRASPGPWRPQPRPSRAGGRGAISRWPCTRAAAPSMSASIPRARKAVTRIRPGKSGSTTSRPRVGSHGSRHPMPRGWR